MADKDDGVSVRYKALVQVTERSLQESVKALTFERLASCYANIASKDRGRADLQKALAQTTEFWRTTALREFRAVFEERDIKRKLAELDEIVADARIRKQQWQSPAQRAKTDGPVRVADLTPATIAAASVRSLKLARIADLEAQVAQLRAENEHMQADIAAKQTRLEHVVSVLSAAMDDLETAVAHARGLPSRETLADFFTVVARRLLEV